VSIAVTRLRTLGLVVAAVAVLGGCADDNSTSDPVDTTIAAVTIPALEPTDSAPVETFAPNGEVVNVLALDNTFRPETIEISAGTEIVWTNGGRNDHNVLPIEGDDWGVQTEDFTPQDVYSHVFTTPGTYPYYCSIHGTTEVGMIGTVVVTG
jgi:plastocyanin